MEDLKPQEADFQLSGKTYTLKKFSLDAQIWVRAKFKQDELESIFREQKIPEIAEIAHYLLKDKTDFPTFKEFSETIAGPLDTHNVLQAMLTTIGLSQPIQEAIKKEIKDPKPKPPKKKKRK